MVSFLATSNPARHLAPPSALAAAAWALGLVPPHERRGLLRAEAAAAVDGLLARVARGRSALDAGLCEGLAALSVGDRLLRLGFSGVGDYGRERLGLSARTAQALARLGAALGERPLLRQAVRRGELGLRAAQEVLPVAVGEAEAAWVARARSVTVRALLAEVRAELRGRDATERGLRPGEAARLEATGSEVARRDDPGGAEPGLHVEAGDPGDGEPWQPVELTVTPAARAAAEEALELAGRVLGEGAPRWQRLEAIAQEYLGAHGDDEPDAELVEATLAAWRGERLEAAAVAGPAGGAGEAGWREALEAALEQETARWAYLEAVPAVEAPAPLEVRWVGAGGPALLDEHLRRLAGLRSAWDALLGHLALLVRMLGLWRTAGFASFAHYCRERLRLGVRSVEQRVALERRLHQLPALREAMAEGRLSAEQARLVAGVADEETAPAWIDRASGLTCLALRRELEAREELEGQALLAEQAQAKLEQSGQPAAGDAAQTRAAEAASGTGPTAWRVRVPVRVAALLAAAFRAAQRTARLSEGRWLDPSECLERVSRHFVRAWGDLPRARSSPQRRALRRDDHRCQVPGCSRAAVHAHHVLFRSRGGGDEEQNLVSLCAAHHLHGVHRGLVRVWGQAPHRLRWTLGERGAESQAASGSTEACARGPGDPAAGHIARAAEPAAA